MKKRFILSSVLLLFCLLSACDRGKQPAEPDFSCSETAVVTEAVSVLPTEPVTEKKDTANKTYGKSKSTVQNTPVLDTAENSRTEDSYRFEEQAVEAAKDMLCETLFDPASLAVYGANVWNCVDDGENVYYSVHMDVSYKVESGGSIERSYFCDIGVRKADAKSFDAADSIDAVAEKYSIYREYPRDQTVEVTDNGEGQFANAAAIIAGKHLKYPDAATFLSATSISLDATYRQYDVQYEAVNDYGMRIACLYSAYLIQKDGMICEVDPMEM